MIWIISLFIVTMLFIAFIVGYKISYSKYANKMLELLKEIRLSERMIEGDYIYYKDKYVFKPYKESLDKTKSLIKQDFDKIKSSFKRKKKGIINAKK